MKKRYWVGQKNIWQENTPMKFNWALGLSSNQAIGSFVVAGRSDLVTALANTGVATFGSAGSRTNTSRFYFNVCHMEVLLTNNSNVPAVMDIYVFKNIHDTTQGVVTCWTNGIKDQTNQAGTDYTPVSGSSPLDAQLVSCYHQIKAIYHITLAPGQTHTHRVDHHICRCLPGEMLANDGPQNNYISGLSYTWLFVARGMPCSTADGSAGASLTPGIIDGSLTQKYEFKYVSDNDINMAYTTNGSYGGTGSAIYNQGSGATAAPSGI